MSKMIQIKENKKPFMVLLIVFIAYVILTRLLFNRVCLIQILCGIPCPGCGMVHAAIYLAQFDFVNACLENVMIFLWIPLILVGLFQIFYLKRLTRGMYIFFGIVCVLTLIYYVYRMITIFPSYPMDYYPGNLLKQLF